MILVFCTLKAGSILLNQQNNVPIWVICRLLLILFIGGKFL
jgi:hypothetical protein